MRTVLPSPLPMVTSPLLGRSKMRVSSPEKTRNWYVDAPSADICPEYRRSVRHDPQKSARYNLFRYATSAARSEGTLGRSRWIPSVVSMWGLFSGGGNSALARLKSSS